MSKANDVSALDRPTARKPLNRRFWSVCYIARLIWHWVKRFFCYLLGNRAFNGTITAITASYLTLLNSSFSDKWEWIGEHKDTHETIFLWILIATLVAQLLKAIFARRTNQKEIDTRKVLSDFIEKTGAIVQHKLDLVTAEMPTIRSGSNKFTFTAHPEEQFGAIARAAELFLRSAYGIKEKQLNITIIEIRADGRWQYIWKHQNWNHSSAEWHDKRKSAAQRCLESNEPEFYADIFRAAEQGTYVLSDRDKKSKTGSAYIYPVVFPTKDSTSRYVVCITTYQVRLCEDFDKVNSETTESFLRELCRRFEVELCLYTIRNI